MGCHPRVRNDQPGHDRTSPWSEWFISIMALQIVNFSAIIIIYSVIILMTVLFFFLLLLLITIAKITTNSTLQYLQIKRVIQY